MGMEGIPSPVPMSIMFMWFRVLRGGVFRRLVRIWCWYRESRMSVW